MSVKYRVYEVDKKDMLNRPLDRLGYKYDDFDSIEQAYEAVEKYQEYVVLPVIQKGYGD